MPGHGPSSKHKHRTHESSSHASSSKGKHRADGSSSQGPPNPSQGKTPSIEPRDWNWTLDEKRKDMPNINLRTHKELGVLAHKFHHVDLQLPRAWLCFGMENFNGDKATNHVYLKFDIQPCAGHPWLGVKLEASDNQAVPVMPNPDKHSRQKYDHSDLNMGLKKYSGRPHGLKYVIELKMTFRALTLGDLIGLLMRGGLTSFGMTTMISNVGTPSLVGCRDFVAQVLFRLIAEGFITGQFASDPGEDLTYPQLACVDDKLLWYWPSPKQLFDNDIFRALACFFEETSARRQFQVALAKASKVEEGLFPNLPGDKKPRNANGYPYEVSYQFGLTSTEMNEIQDSQRDKEVPGGPSGASMPDSSGQTRLAQPHTRQYPTAQLQSGQSDSLYPGPDDRIFFDTEKNLNCFYHRGFNRIIYLDTALQPFPDQYRDRPGNQGGY